MNWMIAAAEYLCVCYQWEKHDTSAVNLAKFDQHLSLYFGAVIHKLQTRRDQDIIYYESLVRYDFQDLLII